METLPDDEERRRPAGEGSREFALFVLVPEGRIQSASLGAERATGLGAAEVVGRPLAVLYADEAVAAGEPARNLETALQWGYFEGESWRVGRDGERARVNLIITALRDRKQRPTGCAVAMRDMTGRPLLAATLRRRNELLLQESEERFARFAGNLPGLAWIKDPRAPAAGRNRHRHHRPGAGGGGAPPGRPPQGRIPCDPVSRAAQSARADTQRVAYSPPDRPGRTSRPRPRDAGPSARPPDPPGGRSAGGLPHQRRAAGPAEGAGGSGFRGAKRHRDQRAADRASCTAGGSR